MTPDDGLACQAGACTGDSSSILNVTAVPLIRNIAHRGASGYLPEHTLAAKAYAYAVGADYLEQDVVLTRDRVPVVLHDIHVDTVTNVAAVYPDRRRADGRYYALDFTLEELLRLEVNERVDYRTGRQVYPRRFPVGPGGFRVHTLADELRLVRGLNHSTGRQVGVYPEIKQPAWHRSQGFEITPLVLADLDAAGYRTRDDHCFLQCFDAAELRRVHMELGSKLRLVQLIGDKDWTAADPAEADAALASGLEGAAQYADGVGPPLTRIVDAGAPGGPRVTPLTARAHALGLEVHPYTLRADDLPQFARSFADACRWLCQEAKVDGLFTDFPDLLRQELDRSPAGSGD